MTILAAAHAMFLARLAVGKLDDPKPRMDASETDFVRYVYELKPSLAERYVAARLMHVLHRLADPGRTAAAQTDGPVALGAFVALCDLTGEIVPDWLVSS